VLFEVGSKLPDAIRYFIKQGTKLKERVDEFSDASDSMMGVQFLLGILEAFRDDFEHVFLDDLLLKVEVEVAADYMRQAEGLLKEGQPGRGKKDGQVR